MDVLQILLNCSEIVDGLFRFMTSFDCCSLLWVNKRLRLLMIDHIQTLTAWDQNVIKLRKSIGIQRCPFDISKIKFKSIVFLGLKVSIKFFTRATKNIYIVIQSLEHKSLTRIFDLGKVENNIVVKPSNDWEFVRFPGKLCNDGKTLNLLLCKLKKSLMIVNITDIENPRFHMIKDFVPFSTSLFHFAQTSLGVSNKTCNARVFYITLFGSTLVSPNGNQYFVFYFETLLFEKSHLPFHIIYHYNLSTNTILIPLNNFLVLIDLWRNVFVAKLEKHRVICQQDLEFCLTIDAKLELFLPLDNNRFIALLDSTEMIYDRYWIIDVSSKKIRCCTTNYRFYAICLVDNSKIKIQNADSEFFLLDVPS